jgi:hypothetical protein
MVNFRKVAGKYREKGVQEAGRLEIALALEGKSALNI